MSTVPDKSEPLAGKLNDLQDTRALARRIGARWSHGQLLVLSGPLGAGKTTLVAALAEALGSAADVSSPTYTLVHEYPTPRGPLAHVDLYRLPPDLDAASVTGLDDLLDRAHAVVIEWGERLLPAYPKAWHLELLREGEERAYRWHRRDDGHAPARSSTAP